ncbi:MAG: DUF6644 family protein [Candidatus Rokuibacteriota bacterium]
MVLVGAAVLFDLRLLGVSPGLPVTGLERHLLRAARVSVALVVPSGILMFTGHATEMADNPAFRLKLALLAAALLNAALFRLVPFRSVSTWNLYRPAPRAARTAAVVSLVLWMGVIACGRLLAYL